MRWRWIHTAAVLQLAGLAAAGTLIGVGPAPAAPFAASAALVLFGPATPAARPRSLLLGTGCGAASGISVAMMGAALPPGPWLSAATVVVAAVVATVAMAAADAIHPPAAALAGLVALHPETSWSVAAVVVLASACLASVGMLTRGRRPDSAPTGR